MHARRLGRLAQSKTHRSLEAKGDDTETAQMAQVPCGVDLWQPLHAGQTCHCNAQHVCVGLRHAGSLTQHQHRERQHGESKAAHNRQDDPRC